MVLRATAPRSLPNDPCDRPGQQEEHLYCCLGRLGSAVLDIGGEALSGGSVINMITDVVTQSIRANGIDELIHGGLGFDRRRNALDGSVGIVGPHTKSLRTSPGWKKSEGRFDSPEIGMVKRECFPPLVHPAGTQAAGTGMVVWSKQKPRTHIALHQTLSDDLRQPAVLQLLRQLPGLPSRNAWHLDFDHNAHGRLCPRASPVTRSRGSGYSPGLKDGKVRVYSDSTRRSPVSISRMTVSGSRRTFCVRKHRSMVMT